MAGVAAGVAGWVCVALGLIGLVLRRSDPRPQVLIVAASGSVFLAAFPLIGVVLMLLARSVPGVVAAVFVTVGSTAIYGSSWLRTRVPEDGRSVRVMTLNMLLGEADADQVVDLVHRNEVDVLFLQELTGAAQDALIAAGLERPLPHRWSAPDESAFGAGVWSRHPLDDNRDYPAFTTATLSARAMLPGDVGLAVVCVHPPAPWPRPPDRWRTDLWALRHVLRALPAGPVVVAGDFNATPDHAPFRRVMVDGFRDAAAQAGAGIPRTWPADRRHPPLLGIDHILTRGAVATTVRTVRVTGSDHLGLLATVVVPR